MRKKEKEVKDIQEIESIIRKCQLCRLAMSVDNRPYIVPLNFGYKDNALYFHTGHYGKKIDLLNQNSNVSFEMDCDVELLPSDHACGWSSFYKSVVGYGAAELITDREDKIKALDIIMSQYTEPPFTYKEGPLEKTCIIKVNITQMSGRISNN